MAEYFKILLISALSGALLMLLCGCGGGTTGTGDTQNIRILGTLKDSTGKSLSQVQVVIAESGDSDMTDVSGVFSIDAQVKSKSTLTLLLTGRGVDQSVSVSGIPSGNSTVNLQLTYEVLDQNITVSSISIIQLGGSATPSPTPTPQDPNSHQPGGSEAGGTVNTAKGHTTYQGVLKSRDGVPIPGAFIFINDISHSTRTDSDGGFSIRTTSAGGSVIITVAVGNASGRVQVNHTPRGIDAIINIQLAINLDSSELVPNGQVNGNLEGNLPVTISDIVINKS